jgi:hypothetical protein
VGRHSRKLAVEACLDDRRLQKRACALYWEMLHEEETRHSTVAKEKSASQGSQEKYSGKRPVAVGMLAELQYQEGSLHHVA